MNFFLSIISFCVTGPWMHFLKWLREFYLKWNEYQYRTSRLWQREVFFLTKLCKWNISFTFFMMKSLYNAKKLKYKKIKNRRVFSQTEKKENLKLLHTKKKKSIALGISQLRFLQTCFDYQVLSQISMAELRKVKQVHH